MKTKMHLFLICILAAAVTALLWGGASAEIAGGSCGDNLSWALDENGVLSISGTGEMADYSLITEEGTETADTPWYSIRENIFAVKIEIGATKIGDYAFFDCPNLTSITIPSSITYIGTGAFQGCTGLTDVYYDKGKSLWDAINTGSGNECLTGAVIHCVVLESDHPYKEFTNETWTYTHPAESAYLKISFSAETNIFDGDGSHIYLTDEAGHPVIYSGRELAGAVICLPGRSFTIRLQTFRGVPCYGFAITDIAGLSESEYEAYCDTPFVSGTWGDNLSWELNHGGALKISGTGSMGNDEVPWANYRKQIKTIQMEDGISNIKDYAFYNCVNLVNVTIPESVTSIGAAAFMSCGSLQSVEIPGHVSSIGTYAFECRSLTSITVPASVTSIGERAFNGRSLVSITVDPENAVYASEDGVLFDKAKTQIITCPGGKTGEYTIPGSVTSIGENSFNGCGNLTGVTIPDSVESIGNYAFLSCSGLTEISIPESVTSIGEGVFSSCTGLTGIEIPDSITSIGNSAFSWCTNLAHITIPDSVASIGSGAFSGCSSLTNITIPAGVTRIENDTFANCSSLTSLTIPDSVTSIGDYVFGWNSGLTDIYYSGTEDQWNNILIGNDNEWLADAAIHFNSAGPDTEIIASGNCGENLTWTLDENGILTITGSGAMTDFTGISPWYIYRTQITSVQMDPGVTTIGKSAFSGFENLESVVLPDSVISIGDSAFSMCISLTGVTIPEHVTSIGNYTFSNCISLTSITIPAGVANIGVSAFNGCTGLTGIQVNNENAFYSSENGVLFDKNRTAIIACPGGMPGEYTVPEGVTDIGASAFAMCSNLTEVTIPDSVTSIDRTAFSLCSSLTGIHVGSGNASYASANGVLLNREKTILILCPAGKTGEYVVPDGVTSIGDGAFANCRNLTGVTIPNGVTSIGDSAFDGCYGLTSVTIPESVTAIPGYAFSRCGNLVSVTIPSTVTEIGELAFYLCESLESITIPNGVVAIKDHAFEACRSLTGVTIPDSVISIDANAFGDCSNLTGFEVSNGNTAFSSEGGVLFNKDKTAIILVPKGITGEYMIPDGVTSIGNNMFSNCGGLTGMVIPDSVTSIGNYAFSWCTGLERITIPLSVTSIGNSAFIFCNNLTDVYYGGTEEQWNTMIGNNQPANAEIHFHAMHTLTPHERVEPTCTEPGTEAYWSCNICGKLFLDPAGEQEIEAPVLIAVSEDHHKWGETEYIWAEDRHTVTAKRVCVYNEEHIETKEAGAVCKVISPTDTTEGTAVYTAEFGEDTFETQTVSVVIPALNNMTVLRLPAGLKTIEREAFANLACEAVIIPEGCTTIEEYAFAGCSNLVYVRMPASMQNGWLENAFDGCSSNPVIDFAGDDQTSNPEETD